MKLSNNDLASQKVKSWTPEDFSPADLSDLSDSSEPDPKDSLSQFFQSGKQIIAPSGSSSRLVKGSDLEAPVMPWMPDEFAGKPPPKPESKWEPAIRTVNSFLNANPNEKADQIIKDARRKAEEIIAHARESAEAITNQAMREGLESSQAEMHDLLQTLRSAVEDTFKWRDEVYSQSEPMVLGLVKTISQTLFGEGFVLDPEVLQQSFNQVLENARSLGNLRIYVNPEDALKLGPAWREAQEAISSQRIEIIPSSSILRGGCYINGQWGSADGRIETRLKAILNTLNDPEQKESE